MTAVTLTRYINSNKLIRTKASNTQIIATVKSMSY